MMVVCWQHNAGGSNAGGGADKSSGDMVMV